MKIEIDQSGRVEYTNKPTVIGFSNHKNKTIIIFATEKQKLQRYFRKINKQEIIFRQIGKKAKIHGIVNTSYRNKKSDLKITANEVIEYLHKIKSGVW